MAIHEIQKRSGELVPFDKDKIQRVIEKAALDLNPDADLSSFDVITDHAVRHIEIKFGEKIPTVEDVQDLVERTLMEYGLFDIAKGYILYRAEHAKQRQLQQTETPPSDSKKLEYIDQDGSTKKLDRKKLHTIFKAACLATGEKDLNISNLVSDCEANLYSGIPYDQLNQAMAMATCSYIERDPAYSKVSAYFVLRTLYQENFGLEHTDPEFLSTYSRKFPEYIRDTIANKRLDARLANFDLEKLAAQLKPEKDRLYDYMGIQMMYDRYFVREEGGSKRLETPQYFWMRIAMGLSIAEKENQTEWAIKFYEILSDLRYTPSTPTLFHAGTTYPQLSSCYLNMVEDDLHHIFDVYSDNAQMAKYSGGIGTSWTQVRGVGSNIKSINLDSQGLIPFLRIANDVNIAINRSGKRRGAACVYLETWHLEIEDFLDLRKNTGDERRRTHDINTAHWIPDLFIKRVISDQEWTLFSPHDVPELNNIYGKEFEQKYQEYEAKAERGEIKLAKKIRAQILWRKMISMLFETGHPWITFKDPCNVRSPQDHVGIIHNSNLCTEITLNNSREETAVCNIGSVNLANHMKDGTLDTDKLQKTIKLAIRMLDNTIDPNFYPTEETRTANMRHRPIGLGLMGFQDALYAQNITFNSEAAVTFADQSMEFISYHAILSSSELAKEKGTYESYKGSKWDRNIFPVDTLDLLEKERGMPIGVSRNESMDWTPVREHVKQYGMRNSNTMAIAPTASISNINGAYPCIEPIYKNLYVKSNMSGEFTVVNKYLVKDLKNLGLWNESMLQELKHSEGSIQDMPIVPPAIREKYRTVFEVGTNWMIKIAAYRGKWIDQSQSLNIFFNSTSGRALSDTYLHAWHLGIKTTYYLRTLAASSIEKSTVDLRKTPDTTPIK